MLVVYYFLGFSFLNHITDLRLKLALELSLNALHLLLVLPHLLLIILFMLFVPVYFFLNFGSDVLIRFEFSLSVFFELVDLVGYLCHALLEVASQF